MNICIIIYVTRPGKTGLIYTKYTCLYYGTYLLFCICYLNSVNFIEFLMNFCIYDDILDMIQIPDKTLLHFKFSKSGQILRVYKTCFPRPGHIYACIFGLYSGLLNMSYAYVSCWSQERHPKLKLNTSRMPCAFFDRRLFK